ncbi:hypothetical protein H6P81_000338 [Aristolochia fimbriata]|uniref:Selenoprotein H n=1 Tax=Aristolochia fimbriata TaxID=158543 RepID=A0AAV7F6B0_ARIFI|nr:hypothetical protein H6P81_000338 [Aristolochia fimbriata]
MAPKGRATGGTRKPDPSISPRRTRSTTVGARDASKLAELPSTKKRKVSKRNDSVLVDPAKPRKSGRTQKNSKEEDNPAVSEAVVLEQKPSKENATEAVGTPETDEKPKAKKKIQLEKQPAASRTIIIEHSKECQVFRRRTEEVKKSLEEGLPGVVVQVNPEKPRRGCFEIRGESGETFVSLLGMPRPFNKLRDLDMDEVVAGIIEKIK